jgi:hypothetical protein
VPSSCNTTTLQTTTSLPLPSLTWGIRPSNFIFVSAIPSPQTPKISITGQQSMDHTCNTIQMIETMKGIFWSIKRHGDVYIAIGAFQDMDRLPDFDDMMSHPALLVPQKIPVDEGAILPYFPNLVEAVPTLCTLLQLRKS